MEFDGKVFVPHPSGRLLTPYTLEMEREFQQVRSELARRYGVVNRLNRITVSTEDDWIGIAASGQTYHELREALGLLGLRRDDELRAAGIRLFQLLMPVPVDEQQVRDFAHGLAEVLVIEEKNPTLELLVKSAMYDSTERPSVVGRRDDRGEPLIPGTGMLDADRLLEPVRRRLAARLDDRLAPLPTKTERVADPAGRQPHALLLQRLSAQSVDAGAGRHAGRRRDRLPRHGRADGPRAGRRRRRSDRDGRRGCAMDRDAAVHRTRPSHPEPGRRHVLPLGVVGGAGGGGRRHRPHLQAACTTAPSP